MHLFDFLALIIYFVIVAGLGFWTSRKVKNMGDFVMPRKFGKTMMLFFGFGSGTHSDQAVSVAAKSYTNGISGIWYQWLWLFVTPFYWLIAPMMRRFRALTTADVFELRFGRSVAMLFAVVGLLQYTVNIGVMLKGSSAVIEASTGGLVNADWAIIIMTVLFVTYGMAGGLHAAVLTDLIQGVLTVVFSFLLLPFIMNAVGGLSGLRENVPPDMLTLVAPAEISVIYVAVIAFNALVGIVAQPHTMANCAAGRTELDGQVGFMGGSFLKRICTVAWTFTGVAAIAHFASQGLVDANPDQVFGEVARQFLPQIMPGQKDLQRIAFPKNQFHGFRKRQGRYRIHEKGLSGQPPGAEGAQGRCPGPRDIHPPPEQPHPEGDPEHGRDFPENLEAGDHVLQRKGENDSGDDDAQRSQTRREQVVLA